MRQTGTVINCRANRSVYKGVVTITNWYYAYYGNFFAALERTRVQLF